MKCLGNQLWNSSTENILSFWKNRNIERRQIHLRIGNGLGKSNATGYDWKKIDKVIEQTLCKKAISMHFYQRQSRRVIERKVLFLLCVYGTLKKDCVRNKTELPGIVRFQEDWDPEDWDPEDWAQEDWDLEDWDPLIETRENWDPGRLRPNTETWHWWKFLQHPIYVLVAQELIWLMTQTTLVLYIYNPTQALDFFSIFTFGKGGRICSLFITLL